MLRIDNIAWKSGLLQVFISWELLGSYQFLILAFIHLANSYVPGHIHSHTDSCDISHSVYCMSVYFQCNCQVILWPYFHKFFSPISLISKLKVKIFHQIFIKKGRILGMTAQILFSNCLLKLVNRKLPDSVHYLSKAPNLALTRLSQSPGGPSILLTEKQEGQLLGNKHF